VDKFETVYEAALRILNFSPQFSKNLQLKLLKKKFDKKIIALVIERLVDNNLLNDIENAKNYTNSLFINKLFGINIVVKKLEEKGINKNDAKEIIKEKIQEIGGEAVVIENFIKKNKIVIKNLINKEEIDKIKTKLYNRGFEYKTINDIFKGVSREYGD